MLRSSGGRARWAWFRWTWCLGGGAGGPEDVGWVAEEGAFGSVEQAEAIAGGGTASIADGVGGAVAVAIDEHLDCGELVR